MEYPSLSKSVYHRIAVVFGLLCQHLLCNFCFQIPKQKSPVSTLLELDRVIFVQCEGKKAPLVLPNLLKQL